MKLALLLSLALILQFNFLQAQNNPDTSKQEQKSISFWAQAGLGISTAKFQEAKAGLLFGVGTTVRTGDNLFSFRYNRNLELNLLGANPPGEIRTVEVLYGRAFAFSTRRLIYPFFPFGLLFKGNFHYLFNVSAGLSYVGFKERNKIIHQELFNNVYSSRNSSGFGVPVELELIFIFSNKIAIGTGIYSNINARKNFLGFRGNVYFGVF